MTYYSDIDIAIHGKAGTLKSLNFAAAMKAARAEDEDFDWVRDSKLNRDVKSYETAQKKLKNVPDDEMTTLKAGGSTALSLNCLNTILEDHPELQVAAVAEVQWETEEHSAPEIFSFCYFQEDGVEPYVHEGQEVNDGHEVQPSVLVFRDWSGDETEYRFTIQELADALKQGAEVLGVPLKSQVDFPVEELEKKMEFAFFHLCFVPAFHLRLSPDGVWSLAAYQP